MERRTQFNLWYALFAVIAVFWLQGSYKAPRPDKRTRFVTTRVDPDFAKELSQYDVTYTGVIESTLVT